MEREELERAVTQQLSVGLTEAFVATVVDELHAALPDDVATDLTARIVLRFHREMLTKHRDLANQLDSLVDSVRLLEDDERLAAALAQLEEDENDGE
jgi:hypothetical protein